jgi:outer membrane protein assembly factor BamB
MMIVSLRTAVVCSSLAVLLGATARGVLPSTPDASRFWPQWRGPLGTGEAPQAKPPVEWDKTKNVRWKTEVPGEGKSTPVVWGDMVVLTAAVPTSKLAEAAPAPGERRDVLRPEGAYSFVVAAYNRRDGAIRWRRVVNELLPHEGHHQDGTYASGSVVVDGQRIYAFFGSRGLYALDLQGRVLWEKQLGRMETRNGFGEGSSPAVHGGMLVVNWDHEGPDFIVGLEAATGQEKWRQSRDEPTTWTTPLIVVHGNRAQAVVGGTKQLVSYDVGTGQPVWQAAGLTMNVIPTPVSGDGMLFATSGFRGSALRAINLASASGEVSGPPALAWSYDRDTPYVPSPLLYRGGLYFLKSNSGILTQLDAKSGQPRFTERLEAAANVYASPVAADGRVYVVGRDGTTVVLAAGADLKILATNALDEPMDASPALVDGEIYMRGTRHLYRISEK